MKLFITSIILFAIGTVQAQKVSGRVVEEQQHGDHVHESPVPGVIVYWETGEHKVLTDTAGKFEIQAPDILPAKLIFSFVGFENDTFLVEKAPLKYLKVTLKEANALGALTVEGELGTTLISIESPWNREILTGEHLKTAACCNVSEVFESNASVDINFSDAVSGAKSIQFLGLDGVYAQIMLENVPFVRGLESRYGLTTMPGSWLSSIQVTKGTGSVVNGYESTTGQLNIEYLKPDDEKVATKYFNFYANHNGRAEANAHFVHRFGDKLSTMVMAHGMVLNIENDHNDDGFRDMPLTKRYGVTNRWRYINDKVEGHIVGGFMHIENEGGQIGFNPGTDKLGTDKYGVGIGARQYYAYWKNGFLFPKLKFASLGLIGHWKRYEQDSYFGTREYTGTQDHAYFNAIYSDILGNTFHNVTTGLGVVYDNMNERLIDSTFSREEIVPGAFFEYTYKPSLRVSVVAGIRGDYNMYFDKLWVSPRLHAKYFISENLAVRVGGGRSYRTPNTISENIMLLASSRDVIVEEAIQYEEAWNYGGSITWDFKVKKREGTLRLDAYQTVFENQLIVDRDISASQVHFYNLTGESYSTVLQADLNYSPHKQIRFNSAYKWSNVKATLAGKLQQVPLVPEHRVMLSAGFKDRKDIWQLDLTANWFGERRLPNTIMNPQEHQLPAYSSDYWQLNAQLTKAFRRFEVYLGAENILNFKQENAIIAANDPFGTYFDASNIWGPLNGRIIYIGLRTKFR